MALSTQNKIAKGIFDFLTKQYRSTNLSVVCDQGAKWGAKPQSLGRQNISLFVDAPSKGRENQMVQSDVAVIDSATNTVPILIEIETTSINPKTPAGIISATNICRWYYPPNDYQNKHSLKGAVLFVVLSSESFGNPKSKKKEQLTYFSQSFRKTKGCLDDWYICLGVDPVAALREFKRQFREHLNKAG